MQDELKQIARLASGLRDKLPATDERLHHLLGSIEVAAVDALEELLDRSRPSVRNWASWNEVK